MSRLRRLWSLPAALAAVALLVALSALFPHAPLRDAGSLEQITEAVLVKPTGYVLMAPVSAVLDALTLFSLRQHIALLCTVIVGYLVWWFLRGRPLADASTAPGRRALREVARVGVAIVVLLAIYTAALVMPRPMARLDVGNDLLAIDFHTHTKYSHDGRPDWTAEDVRKWHRDAGFHVAYITDHRTFDGAREGWANNPDRVGLNTSLLPGIEVVWNGEHVNVLDADRMYQGIITSTLRDIDEQALKLASLVPNAEPVLIETMPGDLSRMKAAAGPGTAGVRAIEVVDGAPKGLGQTRRERARIIHLADSLNLALVAGSDSHGWGHVASAWTLMYLPNWRAVAPDRLSSAISATIRSAGRQSTRVVERWIPDTETGVALPLTVPIVAWGMLRTLDGDERVVWLAWCAALFALWWLRRSRMRPSTAD